VSGRTTDDPVATEILRAELARVWAAFEAGGLAIVPLDVAYAVVGTTERAIRALFAAKQRSYDKPSGMFGSWRLSEETHELPDEKRAMIRALIEEEKLPFSVVAPFRRDARMFGNVESFVLESSSKAGTLDMLMNAGQFHDAMAEQSRRRGVPVFGSSANRSLQGSRYRLQDIDAEVRAAAAVEIDHGRSKFANEHGRSSTIVDFRDWSVLRVGVCFEQLEDAFRRRFAVTLRAPS
jgi:tRNA A37 threonylcarbamoyladenosine synthetase subunit TsaC/SUA5/YrdC